MRYALLILMTACLMANPPLCEVYNLDTEQCETYAENNITIEVLGDW